MAKHHHSDKSDADKAPGESKGPEAAKVGTQPGDGMAVPHRNEPDAPKPDDKLLHRDQPEAKPEAKPLPNAPAAPARNGPDSPLARPVGDAVPQHGDPPSTGLPAPPVHATQVPPAAKVGLPSGGPPAKTPAKTAVVNLGGTTAPQTVMVPAGTPENVAQKTAIELAMKQLGIWAAPVGPTVEWVG